jgi:hypothetical protein
MEYYADFKSVEKVAKKFKWKSYHWKRDEKFDFFQNFYRGVWKFSDYNFLGWTFFMLSIKILRFYTHIECFQEQIFLNILAFFKLWSQTSKRRIKKNMSFVNES